MYMMRSECNGEAIWEHRGVTPPHSDTLQNTLNAAKFALGDKKSETVIPKQVGEFAPGKCTERAAEFN